MLTDHHLEAGDLSGALASLQAMRAKGFKIPTRRFPRLRDAFAGSEDESLKQSFKVSVYFKYLAAFRQTLPY